MSRPKRRTNIPVHIKLAVIERDNHTCQYCGKVGIFAYRYGQPRVIEPKWSGVEIKLEHNGNGECYYCGNDVISFEIDHIKPHIKGGSNRINNLILSCRSCNRKKGCKHG